MLMEQIRPVFSKPSPTTYHISSVLIDTTVNCQETNLKTALLWLVCCRNFPFQINIPCVSSVLWKGALGVLLLGWGLMVSVFITEESVSWLLLSTKQIKIKLKMEILFFRSAYDPANKRDMFSLLSWSAWSKHEVNNQLEHQGLMLGFTAAKWENHREKIVFSQISISGWKLSKISRKSFQDMKEILLIAQNPIWSCNICSFKPKTTFYTEMTLF